MNHPNFREIYLSAAFQVNWGAGVEETLRKKESIRKGRNRRRHSVDDLDSDDGVSTLKIQNEKH